MFFDVTVTAAATEVYGPEPAEGEEKAEFGAHTTLAFVLATVLPLGPQSPPLPVGLLKVPMVNKENVVNLAEALLAAAELMSDPPKQSDLVIPTGPVDLEATAAQAEKLKAA